MDHHLRAKVEKQTREGGKKPIKTWSRRSMIIPDMIGHTFDVHNGRKFISVYVSENMVGHRLGEFSPTRIFKGHSSKKIAEAAAPGPGAGPGPGAVAGPVAGPGAGAAAGPGAGAGGKQR